MVETVEEETEGKGPNGVEILKAASDYLRGSLAEEFADPQIFISDAAYQLLKFHGSYQQDDRDLRNERRRAGETYAFSFMVRLRLPGGDVHPELYLALDRPRGRDRQRHAPPDDAAERAAARHRQARPANRHPHDQRGTLAARSARAAT